MNSNRRELEAIKVFTPRFACIGVHSRLILVVRCCEHSLIAGGNFKPQMHADGRRFFPCASRVPRLHSAMIPFFVCFVYFVVSNKEVLTTKHTKDTKGRREDQNEHHSQVGEL